MIEDKPADARQRQQAQPRVESPVRDERMRRDTHPLFEPLTAKCKPRISSKIRRKAGSGAWHMVRYISRKGSQISLLVKLGIFETADGWSQPIF